MHRLTVVQLLPALQSGGVERSTLEIAAALVRAGHRAVVVSAGGRLVQPLLDAGGEHLTLDIGRKSLLTLRHVVGLRRLFAELGADIVHARSRLPAWLGWYALRGMPAATRPRFVTTVHGLNSPSRYSAVMTYGERVICVSQTVNDYVRAHYPQTDPARVRIIPRGVDIAQFPRRLGADRRARAWAQTLLPGLPADASLLLLPGRGTRLKGHADGLQLLAALRASGVPAWLWLPGAREPGREAYVRELEAEAARLGVAAAVAFTEPTARIAEAYAASDLVLQLSRKPEAFGRTVVEALAVGRPVLGWAHGGVGELLTELQPAGAVPAFDTAALHARALGLLQRPPAPPAVLPYTLQAMQSATLKVYDELRR
ncbi:MULTISPECIES: glycosyltransferase [Xanthomonas]|uniref:Glycosyl transferase n=1 Tax=Xanthomonas cannabis pv. phaseoli TaxID=1885902 RepID=A0AB34P5J3_9XANT|nr:MULTISPECIES: glycosyltransferase [Xanthomonas]KGK56605.1 glycosyl transferase [Xanthomonas cannabis pv. phaseoli]PPU29947.1 glycosyl transferase [Xanthomonas sp. CFBP 7912]RJS06002.1 glycosyl transferase [Xanthomonas sp. CFBP 7698]